MSIDFAKLVGLQIPVDSVMKGVTQIEDSSGRILWAVKKGTKVVLTAKKATVTTNSGGTEYADETFVAIDVYPTTNGVVNVTYNGRTKKITDTSGAAEPNSQTVYFGTVYGENDGTELLDSGIVTIEGGFTAFGNGQYYKTGKGSLIEIAYAGCIDAVADWGDIVSIPDGGFCSSDFASITLPEGLRSIGAKAFAYCENLSSFVVPEGIEEIKDNTFRECTNMTSLVLPSTLKKIGQYVAFVQNGLGAPMVVNVLATTPPEYTGTLQEDGSGMGLLYGMSDSDGTYYITVPKGCLAAYQSAPGWSNYAELGQFNYVIMKEVGT